MDLSLTDDPPLHWIRQATTSSPPSLVNTFCTVNPTSLAFTRYKTSNRRSQRRIDLLLASPTLLTHAPLLDCYIDSGNTSTYHHPVSAILDLPSPALPPKPVRTVFKCLNEREKDDVEAKIHPWTYWVAQNKQALRGPPLDSLVPIFDAFFTEVTGHSHSITSPSAPNIPKPFKHLKPLLKQLPPAKSPHFQHKCKEFRRESAKARATHENSRPTRVHRAFFQHCRLERSIADFLKPDKHSDISLRTDAGNITAETKQVAKFLGDTQQSLGGDPHFVPDEDFVDSLLPQITSAPADVKLKNIPPIPLAWLEDTLKKARPDKAGGVTARIFTFFTFFRVLVKRPWFLLSIN